MASAANGVREALLVGDARQQAVAGVVPVLTAAQSMEFAAPAFATLIRWYGLYGTLLVLMPKPYPMFFSPQLSRNPFWSTSSGE